MIISIPPNNRVYYSNVVWNAANVLKFLEPIIRNGLIQVPVNPSNIEEAANRDILERLKNIEILQIQYADDHIIYHRSTNFSEFYTLLRGNADESIL